MGLNHSIVNWQLTKMCRASLAVLFFNKNKVDTTRYEDIWSYLFNGSVSPLFGAKAPIEDGKTPNGKLRVGFRYTKCKTLSAGSTPPGDIGLA